MTLTLHLGVNEIPYVEAPRKPRRAAQVRPGKQKPRKPIKGEARGATVTTGDVGGYLESKYHLMETFFEVKEEEIGEICAKNMARIVDDLLAGLPVQNQDPFAASMSEVEAMFKDWITTGEAERVGIPGTPTKASIARRSLRFKKKVSQGPRPSVVDSSLFESSFRAWVVRR